MKLYVDIAYVDCSASTRWRLRGSELLTPIAGDKLQSSSTANSSF